MLLYFLSLIETEENKSKFEQIFYQHKKLMLFVALRVISDRQLAEDAVQNAFLKIINHLDDIEEISSHKTKHFIIIITRNAAIDILRKETRQQHIYEENMLIYADAKSNIDLSAFDVQYIVEKIKLLPDIYRDVLQLKIQYDFNNHQIAETLKISGTTDRKRLERARKLLGASLQEEK